MPLLAALLYNRVRCVRVCECVCENSLKNVLIARIYIRFFFQVSFGRNAAANNGKTDEKMQLQLPTEVPILVHGAHIETEWHFNKAHALRLINSNEVSHCFYAPMGDVALRLIVLAAINAVRSDE